MEPLVEWRMGVYSAILMNLVSNVSKRHWQKCRLKLGSGVGSWQCWPFAQGIWPHGGEARLLPIGPSQWQLAALLPFDGRASPCTCSECRFWLP